MISMHIRLLFIYLGLYWPLNQQRKEEIAQLTEVINPECQVEIELVLHNGGKEEYVWNTTL